MTKMGGTTGAPASAKGGMGAGWGNGAIRAFPFNSANCRIVTSSAKAPSLRGGREEALLITPATTTAKAG